MVKDLRCLRQNAYDIYCCYLTSTMWAYDIWQVKKKVAAFCVNIHTSVSTMADLFYNELRRKYYITPKSYLDCVNLYITLLTEKRIESISGQDRFLNGLNKLKETNELIATMKVGWPIHSHVHGMAFASLFDLQHMHQTDTREPNSKRLRIVLSHQSSSKRATLFCG